MRTGHQAVAPPTRHPPDGPLVGTNYFSGRVEAYLGIPFAEPPVGKYRWQPPRPVRPWTTPRSVTEPGPACPQSTDYYPPVGARNESCLYLNVFTAAGPAKALKPVLVYMHGGSFINGGAHEDRLNGSFTVHRDPTLVVVVVQYRLGVLGFAGGAALGGPTSGNYGIQDQRAALEWVQRSAAAFGGDKTRVLLAGQSAGAGAVSVHLVSKRSAGLFSRALMMSGAFGQWITQRRVEAESGLQQLARSVGCATTANGTVVDAACLRGKDPMVLVNASLSIPYGPTIDTDELPHAPWALAQAGGLAPGVPLMLGSTAEDGVAPAAVGGLSATGAQLAGWIRSYFGTPAPTGLNYTKAQVANLSNGYASERALNATWRRPDARGSAAYFGSIRLLADAEMACPARRAARWRLQQQGSSSSSSRSRGMVGGGRQQPVAAAATAAYWYLWAHSPIVGSSGGVRCAYHASDIPFLFHVLNASDRQYALNSDAEVQLSSTFLKYVSSFAATGQVNDAVLGLGADGDAAAPKWPAFDVRSQSRLLFRAEGAEGGTILESLQSNTSGYRTQALACGLWDAIPDGMEPII